MDKKATHIKKYPNKEINIVTKPAKGLKQANTSKEEINEKYLNYIEILILQKEEQSIKITQLQESLQKKQENNNRYLKHIEALTEQNAHKQTQIKKLHERLEKQAKYFEQVVEKTAQHRSLLTAKIKDQLITISKLKENVHKKQVHHDKHLKRMEALTEQNAHKQAQIKKLHERLEKQAKYFEQVVEKTAQHRSLLTAKNKDQLITISKLKENVHKKQVHHDKHLKRMEALTEQNAHKQAQIKKLHERLEKQAKYFEQVVEKTAQHRSLLTAKNKDQLITISKLKENVHKKQVHHDKHLKRMEALTEQNAHKQAQIKKLHERLEKQTKYFEQVIEKTAQHRSLLTAKTKDQLITISKLKENIHKKQAHHDKHLKRMEALTKQNARKQNQIKKLHERLEKQTKYFEQVIEKTTQHRSLLTAKTKDQLITISKLKENIHKKQAHHDKHLKRMEALTKQNARKQNQIKKLHERLEKQTKYFEQVIEKTAQHRSLLTAKTKDQLITISKLKENIHKKQAHHDKYLKHMEALTEQNAHKQTQIKKLHENLKRQTKHYTMKAQAELKNFDKSITPSLTSVNFFDNMFSFASHVENLAESLQADAYLLIGRSDLLSVATLKERFGGKIIWYVNEHPLSNLQRRYSPKLYNKTDRQFITYLDTIHHELIKVIDSCICTGQGYANLLAQVGVPSYNVNRYIDIDTTIIDNQNDNIIRDKLSLNPAKQIILAYPCNIYPTSDFISILKYILSLPKHFVLVHLGNFASKELQSKIEYYRDTMGLKDRVKFCGSFEKNEMIGILKSSHLGIVHFANFIECNRLSLHNRYADLVAAGLPFISTENESLSFLLEDSPAATIYSWTCLESMRNATFSMLNQLGEARIAIRDLRKKFDIKNYDSIFQEVFSDIRTISLISQVDWRKIVELPPFLTYLLKNNLKIKILSLLDKKYLPTSGIGHIISHPNITFVSQD